MIAKNQHVVDHVDDYLHELLSAGDAAIVREHCDACRVCRVALEEAERRRDAMKSLPPTEASEALIERTIGRVQKHRGLPEIRKTRLFWSLATAVALVIGAFHLYYENLRPTPYNLIVLGQNELLAGSNASLRIRLVNHDTGEAVPDAEVEVLLIDGEEQIQLASFTTGPAGSGRPRFRLPDWKDGQYTLEVRAVSGGETERLARPIKLTRSWKLLLSSDKPIYQPGQVIRLRSLALRRPDLHPVAGRDVEYSIADPKGNVIFRRRDVTSRFGIASADCPLANEIIEGPYQIECRVGETVSRRTVEVMQYVLPKFKAEVTLDEPFYEPGQRVRGTIEASYFFGKPVTGGKVIVTAEGLSEIDKIETQTDDEGRAKFELRLPETLLGREQDGGEARVTFVVAVTDTAGQEYETRATRVVTTEAIHVEVIPESGTLVPGVSNRIYVLTRYPDGRPAQTRLAISGQEAELQTSRLGVASFERIGTRGMADVTVRATDDAGRVGRRQTTFYPGRTTDDFLLRTDKAVYNGGDSMNVTVLGGGSEPVFVDLLKGGQTVLTDVIDVGDGQGAATFDLPAELFGTIKLIAYRFGDEGLPVRKQHVLYVRPAGKLKIEAKLDHEQYRPGESATLRFSLTDEQGNPTPGAISLATVDEAVFAVQGARPGMEQAFFTLEQELLQPVYAIYPSWSPVVGKVRSDEDQINLDRAVFTKARLSADGFAPLLSRHWPQAFTDSNYELKERAVGARRRAALNGIAITWTVFGVLFGGVLVIAVCVWIKRRNLVVPVMLGIFSVGVLLTFVLPAFQATRQAARIAIPSGAEFSMDDSVLMWATDSSNSMKSLKPAAAQPRIRQWFPETLLWRPELITDDDGNASLEIDLADSITSWRLSTSAVSADGRLGAAQQDIRVFQPFFVDLDLPVALTRGDELSLPVVVYNYLDKPQTVTLTLEDADWFERLDDIQQQVELPAGAVRSVSYRIRAKQVGTHHLQVTARGDELADAVRRKVTVEPDGRRVETVHNGNLQQAAEIAVAVPADAIPGSVKAIIKLYPSSFSQLVEGLDGIFHRPYGCFEQTSSTTYPNVLALDYLKRTKQSVPLVEAKARQYIHLGYQRLLGFEVPGGGFDWFGRPPANRTLTAYGLMEFQDMARVHDVDPRLIERTRRWLLYQRSSNGSWQPEGHRLHDDPTRGGERMARLSTTAYIAWAVFADENARTVAGQTLSFLRSHRAADIESPYVLALVANALLSIDLSGSEAAPYIARLESLKQTSTDGKQVWWAQSAGERTIVYGSGRGAQVETTATAALAMIRASRMPATVLGSLAWLIAQRGAHGTWPSTQGTVLALKALIAGTGQTLGESTERRVEIAVDGGQPRTVTIPAGEFDVVRQLDLSKELAGGKHRITLVDRGGNAPGYQVAFRYHVPQQAVKPSDEPLSIDLAYSKLNLSLKERLDVTATVTNNTDQPAPMVIADLPIPAGFGVDSTLLDKLVRKQTIEKYQVNPRSIVVYLRAIAPGATLKLPYVLVPKMPVKVTAPRGLVYEYYDPDRQATAPAVQITVVGG